MKQTDINYILGILTGLMLALVFYYFVSNSFGKDKSFKQEEKLLRQLQEVRDNYNDSQAKR